MITSTYAAELWAEMEALVRLGRGEPPESILAYLTAELARDVEDEGLARVLAEGALLEASEGRKALEAVRRP